MLVHLYTYTYIYMYLYTHDIFFNVQSNNTHVIMVHGHSQDEYIWPYHI